MAAWEAKIKAIEGVDLYTPVHVVEMCLVLNMMVLKKSWVPEVIKCTGTQCIITHLKSYYNKMVEVVHDEKLLIST